MSKAVLTAEEIAVLTGRDGADANADRESDFLDDAPEYDRVRAAGDPGGIDGSLGFDVIEIGSGDDKLVGGGMQVVTETVVSEPEPNASASERETEADTSSGIDIINLPAAEDEWVLIARREGENPPSTGQRRSGTRGASLSPARPDSGSLPCRSHGRHRRTSYRHAKMS